MKKIFSILVLTLFLASCDEDVVVFDAENGQTMISWSADAEGAELPVVINGSGTVTLGVNVTTKSSAARTFPVSVVAEDTEADPDSYSFDGTVNIPANSFNGELVVNATDVDVEVAPKTLAISLDEGSDYTVDRKIATVSLFQICPVSEDLFVGDYRLTVINPGVFGAGTFGATGTVLTLSADGLTRSFDFNYFEDTRFRRTFDFTLTCNEITVPRVDQAVGCGGNSVNLVTGPPSGLNGAYDSNDDSSFTINLTDNVDSDCGGSPVQASYRFDKI